MSLVVVLAALVGSALAAPQVAYRPGAYQAYQPLAYPAPYKPLAYSAAPAPQVYKPAAYAAPALSPYKPLAYSAPAYAYNPQVAYSPSYYHPQPQYSAQYAKPVAILRQSQDDNFDGSFNYDFEAENGISSQASGYLKNAGSEAEAQVIQGQYSYTAPDGTPVVTRYYADESGFHAEGSHIPAAPADPYRTA